MFKKKFKVVKHYFTDFYTTGPAIDGYSYVVYSRPWWRIGIWTWVDSFTNEDNANSFVEFLSKR